MGLLNGTVVPERQINPATQTNYLKSYKQLGSVSGGRDLLPPTAEGEQRDSALCLAIHVLPLLLAADIDSSLANAQVRPDPSTFVALGAERVKFVPVEANKSAAVS